MTEKTFWAGLLVLTGLGSVVDGFTTMTTLLYLFQEANILAYAFAVLGSIFVWVFTANHDILKNSIFPQSIKFLVILAIGIDILTSFIGTTYYVALGNPIGTPIDLDVWCCDLPNLGRTLAAFGLAASFNISTMTIGKIWNTVKN